MFCFAIASLFTVHPKQKILQILTSLEKKGPASVILVGSNWKSVDQSDTLRDILHDIRILDSILRVSQCMRPVEL